MDVSDDFFVLKADDARKLLEPPRLASLTLSPQNVVLKPGEQASFACAAFDQYGQPIATPPLEWSAVVGTVSAAGVYTAADAAGVHAVRVASGGCETVAEVRIKKDEPAPDGRTDEGGGQPPGRRSLRWRGTVPPQKWMNFYTKVLSRLASSPDLRLEVSFEIPLDGDQAEAKANDARAG